MHGEHPRLHTLSSFSTRFAASFPQHRKTTPRPTPFAPLRFAPPYLSTTSMTFSVKASQPLPLWEFAAPLRTVNAEFNSKTPEFAQVVRFLLAAQPLEPAGDTRG